MNGAMVSAEAKVAPIRMGTGGIWLASVSGASPAAAALDSIKNRIVGSNRRGLTAKNTTHPISAIAAGVNQATR